MQKINVLSKEVSELIAAGEVIERPASIVKELLENSIDAKASAVTVEIRHGGISYIRITDNGIGMEKEDAEIAFLRHATSKIKVSDDLDNIITLGFRGEALASVAAVSRVELTTKTVSMPLGTRVCMAGGENQTIEEAGCPNGTTIIVRDLFYNVPARLKFLKKDISEGNSISGIIDKIALSHPEISFKLISDNKIKTHTSGNGDILSAIHSIFGKEFATALIPVSYDYNGIAVNGFISKTDFSRTNRAMQHFFVNSRYVKSKTCLVALEEGYKNAIMTGRYPCCVLNIDMPPNEVDVNVHPAKIEVRFVNERVIFDAIYFGVKSAIASDDVLKVPANAAKIPNLLSTFKSEGAEQTSLSDEQIAQKNIEFPNITYEREEKTEPFLPQIKTAVIDSYNNEISAIKKASILSSNQTEYNKKEALNETLNEAPNEYEDFSYINEKSIAKTAFGSIVNVATGEVIKPSSEEKQEKSNKAMPYFKLIGELFKTYILFEIEDSFILLDKHAAHERIIYEKLKATVLTLDRQILLTPVVLTVSNEELQALNDNPEIIEKLGFSYDEFGNNSVIVREVPNILSECNTAEIFLDIANKLIENRKNIAGEVYENLLHSMACRAAIKANDENSSNELLELLKQVYADDEIRHCPHGRPVAIAMTRAQIEKKFGRI